MKKSNCLFALALGASTLTFAQVGIGTTSPSNALDIETTGPAVDINDTGGGDPEINFQISGTTTFSIGIDNSDSDKLKIGTTAPDASTSVTIDASQNVGIGTSSPDTKLEVNGGDLKVTDDAGEVTISDNGHIEIARAWGGNASSYIDFKNLIADDYDCRIMQDNSDGLQFLTGGNGAIATAVTIDASQNVGIGNTSPTATLDVDGSAIFNESGAAVDFRVEGDTEANLLFVDASADRVGIGTSSPGAELDVQGNLYLSASTTENSHIEVGTGRSGDGAAYIDLVGDATYTDYGARFIRSSGANATTQLQTRGTGDFAISTTEAADIVFKTTSTERMTILSGGNVGIGTATPGYTLDVSGNLNYSGSLTNVSDKRFKKDIVKIENALSLISQIDGYHYNFRVDEFPNQKFDTKAQIGFIAQELREVLPQLVSQNDSGYYSVNYIKVVPVLVMAMKEQQAIIEAQKKEIETQKAELDTQKAENAAQEKKVEEVKADASTNAEEIEALKAQVQQLLQLIQQQESASVK